MTFSNLVKYVTNQGILMKSTLDHVAILVDDLEEAQEWYLNHLSGSVVFRDEKYISARKGFTKEFIVVFY